MYKLRFLFKLIGLSLLPFTHVFGITPTAEQLRQFQQLSPDQQRLLVDSVNNQSPAVDLKQLKDTNNSDAAHAPMKQRVITDDAKQDINALGLLSPTKNENAEPLLEDLIELEEASLKPFGYDLFAGEPDSFEPSGHIPMPLDYVVGPGDRLVVQLYGKENQTYELLVSREGLINFPQIGPISLNGLKFSELKDRLDRVVSEQMIGVKASVTMAALRSIQVFVLGEAYKPGAYTLSSLSTITNALFVSGGVTELASLRDIQLKRNGKLITRLDLYDLLLKGDTSKDRRLQPGDVVFIPPIRYTAGIKGEVKRPAIYEFLEPISASDLVELAGGFTTTAYPEVAQIDRISVQGDRTILDVNLNAKKQNVLSNGDLLTVNSVLDQVEDAVLVTGHVHRPGGFKYQPNMRVSDIVRHLSDLKPNPDTRFALIERKDQADGTISTLAFSLTDALFQKNSPNDIQLAPRDTLIFFSNAEDRTLTLAPVVEGLIAQTKLARYPQIVSVFGHVKYPGRFPLTHNMNVAVLIEAAGGLKTDPDYRFVCLVKKDPDTGKLTPKLIDLKSADQANIKLSALDELYLFGQGEDRPRLMEDLVERLINQADKNRTAAVVSVVGAVQYPGDYPLVDAMHVSSLINFAGGYHETAYSLSAEITRKNISTTQNYSISHIKVDLSDEDAQQVMYLQPRDHLVVKEIPKWNVTRTVTLRGEVDFPGQYPITEGEHLSSLMARAGGLTQFADPYGAIFLRQSLKEREKEVLAQFSKELNKQMADLEQQSAVSPNAINEAKLAGASLLSDLNQAKPTGRLVVDFPAILNGKASADLVLRDGDEIVIPSLIQEVSVLGEVQHPTSHLYVDDLNGKGYLNLSGGFSALGDKRRAYVIERNGSVRPLKKKVFFLFPKYKKIKPGDAIVVPTNLDRVAPITYWAQASQILFQLATTAAALNTVGAF